MQRCARRSGSLWQCSLGRSLRWPVLRLRSGLSIGSSMRASATLAARSSPSGARANGGSMVIEGPDGPREAPSTVVPTDPWNQNVVDRTLLFDRTDGKVLQVNVADAGKEPIQVDGRTICARKFIVSGDLERELWYDPAGARVRSRFRREGRAITITRQRSS